LVQKCWMFCIILINLLIITFKWICVYFQNRQGLSVSGFIFKNETNVQNWIFHSKNCILIASFVWSTLYPNEGKLVFFFVFHDTA